MICLRGDSAQAGACLVASHVVTDVWPNEGDLEEEQRELLSWMVEAERSLPREKRDTFMLTETFDGAFLIHPHLEDQPAVQRRDLEELADIGLLRRDLASGKDPLYTVTSQGRRYYAEMKRHEGEPVEAVEKDVRRYLDAQAFQSSFRAAYERWHQAENELWGAETEAQFTKIGHVCREAMQFFASSLVQRTGVSGTPADPAKTVERIRVVLEKIGVELGDTHRAFLKALLAYWGTVSDIVQRQEHGAQKEGQPLTWQDARRVVFQTMIVMFEISTAPGVQEHVRDRG